MALSPGRTAGELVPDEGLPTLARMLRGLAHEDEVPEDVSLANAPLDDEEVSEDEFAAWEEGAADVAAGRVMTTEELRRRLGT